MKRKEEPSQKEVLGVGDVDVGPEAFRSSSGIVKNALELPNTHDDDKKVLDISKKEVLVCGDIGMGPGAIRVALDHAVNAFGLQIGHEQEDVLEETGRGKFVVARFPGQNLGQIRLAFTVRLKIVDRKNGKVFVLPQTSSVKQQISHAMQYSRAHVAIGWRVVRPCGIDYDAVVVSVSPATNGVVQCGPETFVGFEDSDDSTELMPQQKHQQSSSITHWSKQMRRLMEVLVFPLKYETVFAKYSSLQLPPGILLYGPPGTGKTFAIHAIGEQLSEMTEFKLLTFGFTDGAAATTVGAREERLRTLFAEAAQFVESKNTNARCIIFLDEIDGLCPKREDGNARDARTVTQLLTLMDGIGSQDQRVIVVGATNNENALDPALRRPGRFELEIGFPPPNETERADMIQTLLDENMKLEMRDIGVIARKTVGFTYSDLEYLVAEFLRTNCSNEDEAWHEAIKRTGGASSLRKNGFNRMKNDRTIAPKQVGGYDHVKAELAKAVEWRITHKDAMKRLGIEPPRGVMMHGPPGCSKTTLARAIAAQQGFSFFLLTGSDVYSPFVGQAEKTVRDVFATARLALPAVIFIDEIDALVGKRNLSGGGSDSSSDIQNRVLSTLLNEMDGVVGANDIVVIGATNRIDMIDNALLRPGRFDRLVHVPLPNEMDRVEILRVHTKKMPLDESMSTSLGLLSQQTEGKSGAELENICREAAILALRESSEVVTLQHFLSVL